MNFIFIFFKICLEVEILRNIVESQFLQEEDLWFRSYKDFSFRIYFKIQVVFEF